MSWQARARREAEAIRSAGQWREPVAFDAHGPEGKLAPDGRPVVAFAANDYLGLTQHPRVVAAARDALERWGAGSGAARLIVGSRPVHHDLEAELAAWKDTERAVLFPTGFAANLGVLGALGDRDVTICSDELNHASIIDGARLARAEVAIFPHRDLAALEGLVREHTSAGRRVIVASDTVFSMDGDVADVDGLLDLTTRAGALLVLDEAHAVLGPDPDVAGADVLRVGTLSKTLGSLGGFVAGPSSLCALLENRARSYIFTTASTPADTAAALAAVQVVRSAEGDALRASLRRNVDLLRPAHPSPIVPVICGEERRALDAAAALLEQGLLVPAIRPPTVAPGTSRLRVALSAAHTEVQVTRLRDALVGLDLLP